MQIIKILLKQLVFIDVPIPAPLRGIIYRYVDEMINSGNLPELLAAINGIRIIQFKRTFYAYDAVCLLKTLQQIIPEQNIQVLVNKYIDLEKLRHDVVNNIIVHGVSSLSCLESGSFDKISYQLKYKPHVLLPRNDWAKTLMCNRSTLNLYDKSFKRPVLTASATTAPKIDLDKILSEIPAFIEPGNI